jgi:hypothetical protein
LGGGYGARFSTKSSARGVRVRVRFRGIYQYSRVRVRVRVRFRGIYQYSRGVIGCAVPRSWN